MNRRVFVESANKCGTVRWIGFLDGLESQRAGIELDSPSEKNPGHSGEFNGVKIFHCKPNCGLFVKTSKLVFGNTFKEAIENKYMHNDTRTPSPQTDSESSTIPSPILVGEEKAVEFFATKTFQLEEISLDSCRVRFDAESDSLFLQSFTRLRRLSLCGNLVASLEDVGQVCSSFPSLEFADFSSNKLIMSWVESRATATCPTLIELVLDDCELVFDDSFIAWINLVFPNLKRINFRRNEISGKISTKFHSPVSSVSFSYCLNHSFNIVDLANFLTNNSLQSLDIDGIPITGNQLNIRLESLVHLHVSPPADNGWELIRVLAASAPNLKSLTISSSPESFYDGTTKSRAIILVSFPQLSLLNHSIVRPNHRVEAQKYCAALLAKKDSVAEQVIPFEFAQKILNENKRDTNIENSMKQENFSKSYWSLVVRGEADIPVRIPLSSSLIEVKSIVARKISWPLKLSQLGLSCRSPNGDDTDMIHLTDTCDLACLEDDWHVFTAVCDD